MTRRETTLLALMVAVGSLAFYGRSRPSPDPLPTANWPPPRWDTLLVAVDRGGVIVPDSMTVGVPATIRTTTQNSHTCIRNGGTDVRFDGLAATIHFYDIVGSGMPCGAEMTYIEHDASITFQRAGVATLRVERRNGRPLEWRVVVR